MPRKTISRVPQTPRLIREIKPKRSQQQRSSTVNLSHDDDLSSTTNSFAAVLTQPAARQRFHKQDNANDANHNCNSVTSALEETKDHTMHKNNNILRDTWTKYKRIPMRKKMRQLIWSIILYYSLKMIYIVDLELNSGISGYANDGIVNVKTVNTNSLLGYGDAKFKSKSDSVDDGLAEESYGSEVNSYDFLGNQLASNNDGKSSMSSGVKSSDFWGNRMNAAESSFGNEVKSYDSLGNPIGLSTVGESRLGTGVKSYDFYGNDRLASNSAATSILSTGVKSDDFMGNQKGAVKSSFGNEVKSYDFLGNPIYSNGAGRSSSSSGIQSYDSIDSNVAGRSGLVSEVKSYDFLGNPIDSRKPLGSSIDKTSNFESNIQQSEKSYDFLGNRLTDSMSGSVGSAKPGASTLYENYQSNGLSSDRLSNSFDDHISQTESYSPADRLGLSAPDRQTILMGKPLLQTDSHVASNDVPAKPFDLMPSSDTMLSGSYDNLLSKQRVHEMGISNSNSVQSNTSGRSSSMSANNSFLRGNVLQSSSFDTGNNMLAMDASGQLVSSSSSHESLVSFLNCQPHGGPTETESSEIVYWRNISSDASYTSSFYSSRTQEQSHEGSSSFWKAKYLTFEMVSA
jgi:hypothetical protein